VIANITGNGQVLLMVVDCLLVVAQPVVHIPQIAQDSTFFIAITNNITGNGKGLLMVVDCLLIVAQIVVCIPQIAQGSAFSLAITCSSRNF
jgi:hypothetical protein